MKRNQRGEAFTLLVIAISVLMTGAAISMKVHDPTDHLDWLPEQEQEVFTVMEPEDHILYQMKGEK